MPDSRLPKRLAAALRGVDSATAVAAVRTSTVGVAAADATDDYSIPNRILHTSCTAEQLMEAACDVEPVYYAGHIIDYGNKAPDLQQAVQDRIHWFFTMDYVGPRTVRGCGTIISG